MRPNLLLEDVFVFMSEPNEIEDVAAANEESLQTLVRAISLSQGEFSLILVRCNYGELRERILPRLRELSVSIDGDTPLQIRELVLDKSVKTLYTTIQKALQNEQPNALIIFGLESVNAIDKLIVASNQVREEFRKIFPFPIVLWLNDETLQKFIRLAPDFDSWTTTIEFTIATSELIDTLHKNADSAFTSILNAGAGKFLDNAVLNIALFSGLRAELASALRDLQSRGEALDPELEANLQFLQGREAQAKEEMAKARQHYQQSLAFWQQSNRIDRHGCLLFYLGLWCRRYAVLHRAEYLEAFRQAKGYFQQCIQVFQEGNRPDLAAKFINPLGEVLTRLKEWDELEKVAHDSIALHEAYQDTSHLASSGYALWTFG